MKYQTPILLILAIVGWSLFLMKGCSREKEITPLVDTKPIKAKVDKELKQKDSLKVRAVKSESIASTSRKTWRTTKEQAKQLPCDSAIKIVYVSGDSMAVKDSTALADCKKLNSVNDSIISHLQLWIKADSVNYSALQDTVKVYKGKVKKLKRKVFWANFRTALVSVGWIAREGSGLLRP